MKIVLPNGYTFCCSDVPPTFTGTTPDGRTFDLCAIPEGELVVALLDVLWPLYQAGLDEEGTG